MLFSLIVAPGNWLSKDILQCTDHTGLTFEVFVDLTSLFSSRGRLREGSISTFLQIMRHIGLKRNNMSL